MIYLKWFVLCLFDWLMHLTLLVAPPIIALFPEVTTGWRGYVNRVQWMWRNKLYGLAKLMAISYSPTLQLSYVGDPNISDKYKRPGYYFAKLHDGKRLVAFEFYCVLPWSARRNFRCRLGWKFMTDKFARYGFAQFVNTANPFDGYGKAK